MRKVDLIVLHCSATRSITEYTPEQLERDHLARGFSRAGYHYYVRRSGEVVKMRPLEMIPAHVKGHNRHSVGICYEGGLDAQGVPADTRTPEQKDTLLRLLHELLLHYPQSRICGHRDLAAKACPCFDATKEYQRLTFND